MYDVCRTMDVNPLSKENEYDTYHSFGENE